MPIDLKNLEDSEHLLDVLIQCEDILDSLDLYVFKNWFKGQILEGPFIKRHYVSITLLYPARKMPDPRAILRLMKQGIKVEFTKVRKANDKHETKGMAKRQEEKDHLFNVFWQVELKFPRRLLKPITDDLEKYDDEVDTDDVEAAQDSGIDNQSAYIDDENADFTNPDGTPI